MLRLKRIVAGDELFRNKKSQTEEVSPRRLRTDDVYLEIGTKRTFAGAVEWPGWCRSGREAAAALGALVAYAPRYAAVVGESGLSFTAPDDVTALRVVERLQGDASTDFGAPGKAPAGDDAPLTAPDLARLHALLRACWAAFDRVAESARGRALRTGPRGGGRVLERIVDHVLQAEASYVSQLGGRVLVGATLDAVALVRARAATLAALDAAAHGQVPRLGPRGGRRWSPRYFTRRAAWHVLDHVWEIEDRVKPAE